MNVSVIPIKRSPVGTISCHLEGASVWWYSCETCEQSSPYIVDRASADAAEKWKADHPCPPLDTLGIGLAPGGEAEGG